MNRIKNVIDELDQELEKYTTFEEKTAFYAGARFGLKSARESFDRLYDKETK